MSKFKIHIYQVVEEPYDHNVYIHVRRENLETGVVEQLRNGSCTWAGAIAKTLAQVEVPVSMYWITEDQVSRNAWDEAEEESWENW